MATTVLASIGDHGVLNALLAPTLPEVWIDRDLSWLDFNWRVLAEALDERTPVLERQSSWLSLLPTSTNSS